MENIKKVIEKNYGLSISSIEHSDAKTTHNTHIIKDVNGSKFFLKMLVIRDNMNEKKLKAQINIANHLLKKGLNTILPIKAKNGEEIVSVGKEFWLLYPFISIDKNSGNTEEHFKKAVEILAKFHILTQDFDEDCSFLTKPMHEAIDDITFFTGKHHSIKRRPVLERAREKKDPFSKKIVEDSEFINSLITKVVNSMKTASFTMKTILHYDLNKENLFFSNGKFVAVSDFEYSHRGFVETDLAKTARYWAENKVDATIDISRFKKFILLYAKYNKGISLDWNLYYTLLIYAILRRVIYAADWTIAGIENLEFLYDYDLKMLRYLKEHEKEFKSK